MRLDYVRLFLSFPNVLVICNHYPHPRASARAGDSRGNERGFDRSFAMAVRGKYPGFALYRQKGCEVTEKRQAAGENNSGFTNEQSPRGGTFSGDLLDQKSKSPLFHGGGDRRYK